MQGATGILSRRSTSPHRFRCFQLTSGQCSNPVLLLSAKKLPPRALAVVLPLPMSPTAREFPPGGCIEDGTPPAVWTGARRRRVACAQDSPMSGAVMGCESGYPIAGGRIVPEPYCSVDSSGCFMVPIAGSCECGVAEQYLGRDTAP